MYNMGYAGGVSRQRTVAHWDGSGSDDHAFRVGSRISVICHWVPAHSRFASGWKVLTKMKLAASKPVDAHEVRIIISAFRAERTIRQCVDAIVSSEIKADYELVVVDDGGSENLAVALAGLPVTIISTGGSGSAAVARNQGAKGFSGRYIIFIDSDVLVLPHCVERLLAPLRTGQADATVGNYSRDVDGLSFAARYKQLYIARVHDRRHGYLKNFWTAIGAIDAPLFQAFGGFDSAFKGCQRRGRRAWLPPFGEGLPYSRGFQCSRPASTLVYVASHHP